MIVNTAVLYPAMIAQHARTLALMTFSGTEPMVIFAGAMQCKLPKEVANIQIQRSHFYKWFQVTSHGLKKCVMCPETIARQPSQDTVRLMNNLTSIRRFHHIVPAVALHIGM